MNARRLALSFVAVVCAAIPCARAEDAPVRFLLSGHYQLRLNDKVENEARSYQVAGDAPRLILVAPSPPPWARPDRLAVPSSADSRARSSLP